MLARQKKPIKLSSNIGKIHLGDKNADKFKIQDFDKINTIKNFGKKV